MKKLKIAALTLMVGCAVAMLTMAVTPITSGIGTDFTGLKQTCKEYHITAKETNTLVAQTARLYYIMYNVSAAGTAWTLTVQDKQGTAAILAATGTLTASTVPVVIEMPKPGALMSGGVDIITGGTTAGTMDLWACYR